MLRQVGSSIEKASLCMGRKWLEKGSSRIEATISRGFKRGRLERVFSEVAQHLSDCREQGSYYEAGDTGLEVGFALSRLEAPTLACPFLEQAIKDYYKARNSGEKQGPILTVTPRWAYQVAECNYRLGVCNSNLGKYSAGAANLRRAARAFKVMNYHKKAGESFLMMGSALRDYGLATERIRLLNMALAKYELANESFREGVEWEEQGAEVGLGVVYISSATALLAMGRIDEVVEGYPGAMEILQRHGDPVYVRNASLIYEQALRIKAIVADGRSHPDPPKPDATSEDSL